MNKRPVIIASRGSKLALYQAQKVKEELEKHFPERKFAIDIVKTKGDKILDVALSKIGDKGLFTKELEVLLTGLEADIAVHSLKDMPTELPSGLILGGVLERGEVRDALVSINGKKLHELDESDIVATSSLRRRSQLLNFNSRLKVIDIRGNVDTRLKKMEEGYCTAQIMAAAGLQRLGLDEKITEIIDIRLMLPAVSQGAIAIEIRQDDPEIFSLIKTINHSPTLLAVEAERAFLRALEGGCQIPIGCFSETNDGRFKISGCVSNPDGTGMMKGTMEDSIEKAGETALRLARKFLDDGAGEMIQKIRTAINS